MNKGYILIDVIISLMIITLIVYSIFFSIILTNNTISVINLKLNNIDRVLGYE